MSDEFEQGDRVSWKNSQGRTTGRVKRKLTTETEVGGWTAQATEEEPQYLVESDATGAEAAHRPEALEREPDR